MATNQRTDAAFTPASLGAVVPNDRRANATPVRLSFEPWGRRLLGDPDPDAPGYQRLDGWFTYAHGVGSESPVAHFRDVAGREYVLTAGRHFQTTGNVPEGLDEAFSLAEYRLVLGRRAVGGGYVPVAVNPVFFTPE